jgi:hypothetical protein
MTLMLPAPYTRICNSFRKDIILLPTLPSPEAHVAFPERFVHLSRVAIGFRLMWRNESNPCGITASSCHTGKLQNGGCEQCRDLLDVYVYLSRSQTRQIDRSCWSFVFAFSMLELTVWALAKSGVSTSLFGRHRRMSSCGMILAI